VDNRCKQIVNPFDDNRPAHAPNNFMSSLLPTISLPFVDIQRPNHHNIITKLREWANSIDIEYALSEIRHWPIKSKLFNEGFKYFTHDFPFVNRITHNEAVSLYNTIEDIKTIEIGLIKYQHLINNIKFCDSLQLCQDIEFDLNKQVLEKELF
jgi:hypothetical protein